MIRSSDVRAEARRLERAVAAELAEYDTARARLRDVPDAVRLGAALDRRGLWQPVSAGGNADTDELAHRVSVASSMHAAMNYIDTLAGLRVRNTPRAHPCDLVILCDVHTLCLPAGLDNARYDGIAVQTHPGKWRQWSAPSDVQQGDPLFDRAIPAPADLPHLMTAWAARFARPAAWSGVHPVIHVAMAIFALARTVPFQDGNRRPGSKLPNFDRNACPASVGTGAQLPLEWLPIFVGMRTPEPGKINCPARRSACWTPADPRTTACFTNAPTAHLIVIKALSHYIAGDNVARR